MKTLIQQSREKLVIAYETLINALCKLIHSTFSRLVANDLSSYDTNKYHISVAPNPTTGKMAFHLGEPIVVNWQAPLKHSRKDWIGIYRVCSFPWSRYTY